MSWIYIGHMKTRLILVTGATGYVGGRLVPALLERGYRVRCLVRDRSRLPEWASEGGVEIRVGDASDAAVLGGALAGVDTAFYLLHGMEGGGDWVAGDRRMASSFADHAGRAGVGRIVYLGGLGSGRELSTHLASRQEVGRILRESGVPTVEFRASIIIGAGSLSFELIRDLVERLPVMLTPRWVRTPAQPIAIADVITYLTEAVELEATESVVYEIGGPAPVSYGGLMREYARQRGLRRWMIPVPVLTPWLSGLWLRLVTPLRATVGRSLLEGVRNPTVVRDDSALSVFGVRPAGVVEAIHRALEEESSQSPAMGDGIPDKCLSDRREAVVPHPPEAAFLPIARVGGGAGWYFGDWLWRLRGRLDRLIGGPGLRKGRPASENLRVGDRIDFWRVVRFEPGRRLVLEAEMKVPGRAWLSFTVTPTETGSLVRQTAVFQPRGTAGRLYWYALWPLHELVFRGMLRGIVRAIPAVSGVTPGRDPGLLRGGAAASSRVGHSDRSHRGSSVLPVPCRGRSLR